MNKTHNYLLYKRNYSLLVIFTTFLLFIIWLSPFGIVVFGLDNTAVIVFLFTSPVLTWLTIFLHKKIKIKLDRDITKPPPQQQQFYPQGNYPYA